MTQEIDPSCNYDGLISNRKESAGNPDVVKLRWRIKANRQVICDRTLHPDYVEITRK